MILISQPRSWQAYYWWLADDRARRSPARSTFTASPATTRWSCCFDPVTKGISLDARRIKGSHGAPGRERAQHSVLVASEPIYLPGVAVADTDVFDAVLRHFGVESKPAK